MTLILGDLIESARDWHPTFTKERHPDAVLARLLSMDQKRLVGKGADANPVAMAVWTLPVLFSAYDFTTGYTLPEHHRVLDGEAALVNGTTVQVPQVSNQNRLFYQRRAGFWMEGKSAYLFGNAQSWADATSFRIQYVPAPSPLTSRASVLALPDSAESVVVAVLAERMALRSRKDEQVPVRELQATRREVEKEWLDEVLTKDVTSWVVGDRHDG